MADATGVTGAKSSSDLAVGSDVAFGDSAN